MENDIQLEASAPLDLSVISRRDAIQRVTAMLGGVALVGGNALLTACAGDRSAMTAATSAMFTPEQVALLDEIADTILPATGTPGAKAAGVGPFMAHMVEATYRPPEQEVFRGGLARVEAACEEAHGTTFMEATPEQRLELLEALDRQQKAYMDARQEARVRARREPPPPAPSPEVAQGDSVPLDVRLERMTGIEGSGVLSITADAPTHYFRMIKELALLGYFTSEIGYTQAMRYIESPGRFDPCVPYAAGDRAWAPHA